MKLKKAAAIALALATTAALSAPATALAADSDPTAGTPAEIASSATGSNSASSAITGTIKPTTLKVSVPTVVSFDVDPGKDAAVATPDANKVSGQFRSPSNFTVTNYSVVDVYGYVSGVTATGATLSQTGATAGAHAADGTAWTTEPAVQIVASDTAPTNFSTAADWFDTAKTKKLYAFNEADKGKLAASADGTTAGGEATMYLFGQVAKTGWKANDTFTVTPTFTIAVTDPGTEQNA